MENKIDLELENKFTNAFIELFEEKIIALSHKIETANDKIKKVNYEIERFYVEEDVYAGKLEIKIIQEDAKKIMNRKLERYNIIIGLLVEKYNTIKGLIIKYEGFHEPIKVNSYIIDRSAYKCTEIENWNALEFVNAKLELLKLKQEILSKEEFLKQLKTRINVFNTK